MKFEHWTNGLLAAAAGVFIVDAVFAIGLVGPIWLRWTLLGTACGLVVLTWLSEAGRTVWRKTRPAMVHRRGSRHAVEDWAQTWEELMKKPVR